MGEGTERTRAVSPGVRLARPGPDKERLAWPDLARGACMVLVVLLHADHALRHIGQNDEHLHLLNELLVPLRQPLFFLISGMLGAGILARGAPGVLVHRVGRYLWLYVLLVGAGALHPTSARPLRPVRHGADFFTHARQPWRVVRARRRTTTGSSTRWRVLRPGAAAVPAAGPAACRRSPC